MRPNRLTIVLPLWLYKKIKAVADEDGESMSKTVRRLIRRGLIKRRR